MDIATVSTLLLLISTTVIPLASAFLSRQHWPQEVTSIIAIALGTIAAFISEWAQDPHEFSFTKAGYKAILAWLFTYISRNHIWKSSSPTSLDKKALAWPRRLPPGGVQPGIEPGLPEAA